MLKKTAHIFLKSFLMEIYDTMFSVPNYVQLKWEK